MHSSRPPSFSAPPFARPLLGERVEFRNPWLELLALTVSLIGALALSSTGFGRLLAVPLQIQFHELGHALVAWLSSVARGVRGGDFGGAGLWRFEAVPEGTRISLRWQPLPTRWLLRVLSRVVVKNHSRVMQLGFAALDAHLNGTRLAA